MDEAMIRKRCEELAAEFTTEMLKFSAKLTPPAIGMIAIEGIALEKIRAAYADGQRDGMERAAGIVCPYCNDPEWPRAIGDGVHISPNSGSPFTCNAWKIRQAAGEVTGG